MENKLDKMKGKNLKIMLLCLETSLRQMPQTSKETKPVSVKENFEFYNNVIKILLNNQNYSWKK